MMSCPQCQGIEKMFDEEMAARELSTYRSKGADKTTRMLTAALKKEGVRGLSLLDIGGGVGAVQHELLDAGVENAIDVDASRAYLNAAREEAQRRGFDGRVSYQFGDFVDIAAQIPSADIVTLDRVICCYPDMEKLVSLSAAKARKLYALVYPRDNWWVKIGIGLENIYFRLRKSSYQAFVHPTRAVDNLMGRSGFRRHFYTRTFVWQVVVYAR